MSSELSETLNELYNSDPESYDITIAIMNRITALETKVKILEETSNAFATEFLKK